MPFRNVMSMRRLLRGSISLTLSEIKIAVVGFGRCGNGFSWSTRCLAHAGRALTEIIHIRLHISFDWLRPSMDFHFHTYATTSTYVEHWRRRIRYHRRFSFTHMSLRNRNLLQLNTREWKHLNNNNAWCNRIQLAAASKNNLNYGNIPSVVVSHFLQFIIAINFENRRASAMACLFSLERICQTPSPIHSRNVLENQHERKFN